MKNFTIHNAAFQLPRIEKPDAGFSILEILIVIGLAGLIAAGAFAVSLGAYQRYAFSAERDLLVSLLQRARSQALANINESAHGLVIENDSFIAYEDTDESGDFDAGEETLSVPRSSAVAASGDLEFLFAQLSGEALSAGTLTLTGPRSAVDEAVVQVEDNGRIDLVWN